MRNHATAVSQELPDAENEQRLILHGESFIVSVEDGVVILSHPVWSLMGIGASLTEAEAALIAEAFELRDVMRTIPEESLNGGAHRMKEFLDRIATP
jgi:hypothetical protein